jgi:hypothetical protein
MPKVKIEVPMEYFLLSNSPNPFKTTTTIEYGLPERGRVTLNVYNAMGALVAGLVEETQETGRYKLSFDGSKLPAGVYYARFTVEGESGQFVDAVPMVLIR